MSAHWNWHRENGGLALLCFTTLALLMTPSVRADDDSPPEATSRLEYSAVPAVTYNRDDGLGVGLLGVLAQLEAPYQPFRWRFELLTYFNLRQDQSGKIFAPTHAHWLLVDLPQIFPSTRMKFQAGYASLNRFYYGLGNRSQSANSSSREVQYQRAGLPMELTARVSLPANLFLTGIVQFTHNDITVYEDSRLKRDMGGSSGDKVQSVLHGVDEHALTLLKLGLEWDTRDHEVVPTNGMLHEIQAQGGLGMPDTFYFGAVRASFSGFYRLLSHYLVLAARLSGQASFGQMPFYLLPRVGGPRSVRGVPLARYLGMARVIGNLELRSRFIKWGSAAHTFHLGTVAFVDAGRVWADLERNSALDGEGLGLKVGTGGGIRFQWGETVLLRFDGAWSPDGVGYYVDISHAF